MFWLAAVIAAFMLVTWVAGAQASDCSLANYGTSDSNIQADPGDKIKLEGPACGCGNSGVSWRCNGGTLSDSYILRPIFEVPLYDYNYDNSDRTYTCTMTFNDNNCGSRNNVVSIHVKGAVSKNLKVALIADPKSTCAPSRRVDLTATLSGYDGKARDYTYNFDCESDGVWEKIVTTGDTSYAATGLCDYSNVGSHTARVKVTTDGRTVTDTDIVRATDCNDEEKIFIGGGQVSITKTVSDINRGTGYQGTVSANPGDTVSYKIVVAGDFGVSNNVVVRDTVPNGITNIRDLRIDGSSYAGNLISGINIGSLRGGQIKVITYTATVSGVYNLGYGQNTITNTATVLVGGNSADSSASLQVYVSPLQGATAVSTGFGGDMPVGIVIALALAMVASLGWLLFQLLRGDKAVAVDFLVRKISFVKKRSLA